MQNDIKPDTYTPFRKIEPEDYLDQFDRRKLLLGVPRHWLLILVCMAFFTVFTTLMTYRFLTTYKAEAIVLFQEEGIRNLSLNGSSISRFTLQTILDMIKLPTNYQATRAALGLELTPDQIEMMTDVPQPKNNSNLIRIIATASNPNVAIDVANALAKSAVKSSQEFAKTQIQNSLDSLQKELQKNRHQTVVKLQEIEDFKVKHQYFEMTADNTILISQMVNARIKLENAKLQYKGLLVEYENLKKEVAKLPGKVPSSQLAAKSIKESALESKILAIEASLAEARARYAQGNPKLARLEDELHALVARSQEKSDPQNIVDEAFLVKNINKERLEVNLLMMQAKVIAAEQTLQDVQAVVDHLGKKVEKLPSQQITFTKLIEEKKILDDQAKLLTTAVESAKVFLNSPSGTLEFYQIADKAAPLRGSPLVKMLPIFGLIFGAGFGLFFSYIMEMHDRKLRTSNEIDISYTVPCLEVIPEIRFLTPQNGEIKTLFYMRELADRLEKELLSDGALRISITSSLRKEGKSLVATYLAHYLKRLDKRVVFISFDPSTNPFIEEDSQAQSISDYLKGETNFEEIRQTGSFDRLLLLRQEENMKELVKTPLMERFWEEVDARYDVAIVDVPALIESDYGINIVQKTPFSIFMIDSSKTPKSLVDQTLELYASFGIQPSGILLNRVLPIYVEDAKTQREIRKNRKKAFWKLFSKKSNT